MSDSCMGCPCRSLDDPDGTWCTAARTFGLLCTPLKWCATDQYDLCNIYRYLVSRLRFHEFAQILAPRYDEFLAQRWPRANWDSTDRSPAA